MRNKATTLILAVLILVAPSLLYAFEAKVVGVSDGDTIKILKDGKQVKIRLAAIDCPEKGQPYGQKAKQFTADMVDHNTNTYEHSHPEPTHTEGKQSHGLATSDPQYPHRHSPSDYRTQTWHGTLGMSSCRSWVPAHRNRMGI